jgi:hypothetical protein
VVRAPPNQPIWGWPNHPQPPPWAKVEKEIKKKKKKRGFDLWGWPNYLYGPRTGMRVAEPPPRATLAKMRVATHTYIYIYIYIYIYKRKRKKKEVLTYGGGRTTSMGHEGGSATPRTAGKRVAKPHPRPTLAKMRVATHPYIYIYILSP